MGDCYGNRNGLLPKQDRRLLRQLDRFGSSGRRTAFGRSSEVGGARALSSSPWHASSMQNQFPKSRFAVSLLVDPNA
jgi:hypothetical protein